MCSPIRSSNENVTVHVGEYEVENSKCEKLLGVKLDWKLNFDDKISDICKRLPKNQTLFREKCNFHRIIQIHDYAHERLF